ncbi:mannonate dehydratase [Halosimplex amylolyticum]|uniref:mannonate dehydratase n=1 Tax=Halosimplex amylolyticum TaxID=3396616 RepID=UPI003F57C458
MGVVPKRTTPVEVRGGAEAAVFDLSENGDLDALPEKLDRGYTETEFWENHPEFLETVIPVAETTGIEVSLHPVSGPVGTGPLQSILIRISSTGSYRAPCQRCPCPLRLSAAALAISNLLPKRAPLI